MPFSGFRQWDLTSRSQICHDCCVKEGQPRLPRTLLKHRLWNSPIGAFGADTGLHSRIVSPAGAIQNQHTRKTSPLAKDSKRPRNDKDQEDFERTRVGKVRARVCVAVKIDTGTASPRGVIGVWPLFFLSFPHPERPSWISQHERSELLCGCSPL